MGVWTGCLNRCLNHEATIEVVCYKSKVLANNESPLMLRITKDRKLKYSSIGVSVNPALWDFEKNKPRRNCPNRLQIERLIAGKSKPPNGQR